jgi:hypothetical protein
LPVRLLRGTPAAWDGRLWLVGRYGKAILFLEGSRVMTEPPLIKKIVAESKAQRRQEDIVEIVKDRFGKVPDALPARLRTVRGEKRLLALLKLATRCPDLEAFQAHLPA